MNSYVEKKATFLEYEMIAKKLIQSGLNLPDKIFNPDFQKINFFHFEDLFTSEFLIFYKSYLDMKDLDKFVFYCLDPKPRNYFYENFGYFGVVRLNKTISIDDYLTLLNSAPEKNSPDTLLHNSNELLIFSKNNELYFYGNRELELGIAISMRDSSFKDLDYGLLNFYEDISEYTKEIKSIKYSGSFDTNSEVFFSTLINNFS